VVTDPAVARGIGLFDIYHNIWASIEREKVLMHCGNTTFIYHEEFNKYMKVEGATAKDAFDYLVELGARKSLLEKKNIHINYLKKGSRAS